MGHPTLGVVVVTFNAAEVILDCLESLLAAQGVCLRIVVVDNASCDDTVARMHDWASGLLPYTVPSDFPFALQPCVKPLPLHQAGATIALPRRGHTLTLIQTDVNGGFAAGVNQGIAYLAQLPGIDRYWVLNPDCAVPSTTPQAFAAQPEPVGGFALMGGRVIYLDDTSESIQIDGGLINRWTGVTKNVNQYAAHSTTPPPDSSKFSFITGASMVASRTFYELAGPMTEDYFLYYEEVDWAMRRGKLPLIYCANGIVFHRAGTAVGSPAPGRTATPFSLYFKHRGRMRFMRRFFPGGLATAYVWSLAKAAQLLLKGYAVEAWTLLVASLNCPPPAVVRARLSPEAARLAFGAPKLPKAQS